MVLSAKLPLLFVQRRNRRAIFFFFFGYVSLNYSDCCAKRTFFKLQPDFQEQKSPVHEVIKTAGNLCIFLPKFHCELKFFFRGM